MASRTTGAGPRGLVLTEKSSTWSGLRPSSRSSAADTDPCATGGRSTSSGRARCVSTSPTRGDPVGGTSGGERQREQGGQQHGPGDQGAGGGQVGHARLGRGEVQHVLARLLQAHMQLARGGGYRLAPGLGLR